MTRKVKELVLPGSELEAAPLLDRRSPLVLRIVRSSPHGSAWRYDLVWYALEPGRYDLRSALRRKDGSSTADLPELPVEVVSALTAAFTPPHELATRPVEGFGNYRMLVGALVIVWIGGYALILVAGRRRAAAARGAVARSPTFAERIRPLVARGIAGTITAPECAELERLLVEHWAERLDLVREKPATLYARLLDHAEAGPLLRRLENWLHRPPMQGFSVDGGAPAEIAATGSSTPVPAGELEELLAHYFEPAKSPAVRVAS
jgi:hypothetical protein